MTHIKMVREILKTSGWTQEQLAGRLGVSFATVNSWINGKTEPRPAMYQTIERLYLAQDVTGGATPIFVTLVNVDDEAGVGDFVVLTKDRKNRYDDEAIMVTTYDDTEEPGKVVFEDERMDEALELVNMTGEMDLYGEMYVANSVSTVVRGTYSAGRIYDKFGERARAQIVFIRKRMAIARVVDWKAGA